MNANVSMVTRVGKGQISLSAGAMGSLLLHGLVLVLVLLFVHGVAHLKPPKPPALVTLDLTPPPPPKPPPTNPKPPPPKPHPTPQPTPVPEPITSQTMSSVPMPAVPPPPAPDTLAPATPLRSPPQGPQPGVVGYRISNTYKSLLQGKIQAGLRYPASAARQGREGSTLVLVRMKRDGSIEYVSVVSSSGTSSLDQEARAVFRRIGKFPPLPDDFLPAASEFQFEIPINFNLVDG